MHQLGYRGLNLRPDPDLTESIDNVNTYGVDWDVHRSRRLMQRLRKNNPNDEHAAQSYQLPTHMARVDCEPPDSPFTSTQKEYLRRELLARTRHSLHHIDMPSRRLVWQHAFGIAREIFIQRIL
jgi:hypothetical protein